MPDDLFDDMAVLTYVHLATHPLLPRFPSLNGPTNLKSLSLVNLESLEELPSLHALTKLERLELLSLSKLARLPDLTAQTRLVHFVVGGARACCNGFVGACDVSRIECQGDQATCVASDATVALSAHTTQLLETFAATVCATTSPAADSACAGFVSQQDGAALCDGVMYRQCAPSRQVTTTGSSNSNSSAWMCYNARMQVISCVCSSANVAIRKMQIQKDLGRACSVREEAWLGCSWP